MNPHEAQAEDPEVDVVSIASLHSHHHGHAHLMLMAGKHLLVAKPLTMNAAHDLIAPARDKGLFVMDAMWTLCNPLYRRLQAPVAARETGTPRAFAAQIGPMGTGSNTRILDLAQGGSFTLECLTYPLNIPAGLAPGLTRGASVLTAQGVDSAALVTLKTVQGQASLAGGFVPATEGTGGRLPADRRQGLACGHRQPLHPRSDAFQHESGRHGGGRRRAVRPRPRAAPGL